jgi:hypothetical protein
MEQEDRQQCALLLTPDPNFPALVPHVEPSEDSELHAFSIVTGR